MSSSKIEEVSQNFSLWMLSSSKIEGVSQIAAFSSLQIDRKIDGWIDGWIDG